MSLLDTASLIVTPNGYKEGKLYSVIPSDGSGDLSVTRATTATRVNSQGLVELVPYNLVQYSQEFNNAWWDKYQVSVGANQTTAPDGTLTAESITNSLSAVASVYKSGITNYGTNTLSCYFKKGTHNYVFLELGGNAYNYVLFNIAAGSVDFVSGFSNATIEDAGNGWWRCYATASDTAATVVVGFGTGGSPTAGDVTYLWGAQLNEGTIKPYQKTETRLNIPRLDYSNGTCPSILVEPQRTNLLQYSSSFDNGSWGAIDTTITANTTISPSGVQDAETMTITSSTSRIFQMLTLGAGTYTASIYVKSLSGTPTIQFRMVVDGVDITQSIPTTTDWVRHDFTFTSALAVSFFVIRGESGTGSVSIWGAQLESGSYATSYIPTTSASVTRNADVLEKNGITSLIGQTEGTLFLDVDLSKIEVPLNVDTFLILNDGTNNNEIAILLDVPSGAPRTWLGLISFGGSYQCLIYDSVIAQEQRYKIALAYKANDVVMYINGVQVGTDTSVSIPNTFHLSLSKRADGSWTNECQTRYNASALWKTRLTNAQLATLTTI